jgi:cyanate permease
VGYALAPLAVGALHRLTHSWTPALILVASPPLFGLGAGRDRQLSAPA